MESYQKDTLPLAQVEMAWGLGKDVFADNPFGLEILRAGNEAAEALFLITNIRGFDGDPATGTIKQRQDLEVRLYTVFVNAVNSFRVRAWSLTHDKEGRTTDPKAWERFSRISETFLPLGRHPRIARSGALLYTQSRHFCIAVRRALPGSDDIVAPVELLLAACMQMQVQGVEARMDRPVSSVELEQRRKELQRLRRAGYHLMKCMEAWDPSFKLDADSIYGSRRRLRRKANGVPKVEAESEEPGASSKPADVPTPRGPPSSPGEEHDPGPGEDLVSLAELEALHTELHDEQPERANGS